MTDVLAVVLNHVTDLDTALLVLVLLRLRVTLAWTRRTGFRVSLRF
ncbi:hypothetical protein [Vibrio crassostreae]|nr:hypothetical protein [Vibrio crassostreae]